MLRSSLIIILILLILPSTAFGKLDKETVGQVHTILEKATRSGDHLVRSMAVEAYGLLKTADSRANTIDALKDPVFRVRAAAMRALIRLKDKSYEQALMDTMANPRRDMVADVLPLLAMLPDKSAVGLSHRLLADEKATTKNELIEAWGSVPGKRRQAFFKPLLTNKDTHLAEAVQDYVLTLKGSDALPLIDIVLKVGNPGVREKALDRLAALPKGIKLGGVKKLMKSGTPGIKMRAAEVLAHHGHSAAKKVLMPVLSSKVDKDIIRALAALSNLASGEMVPLVEPFLKRRGTHHEIVKHSLEILYRLKHSSLVGWLRKLRNSDNIRVQAHSIYYLGLVERGRGLPVLHEYLKHGDPNVRLAAIEAIGKIASRESIPLLSQILDDTRTPKLRVAIVKALAGIRDKDIIRILQFLINDNVPGVAKWAITGLMNVRHKDAVSTIRLKVNTMNESVRSAALKAIVQLDKNEGITAFRQAVSRISGDTLRELAALLRSEAIPYLNMALTAQNREIRETATELLAQYKKQQSNILATALGRTRDNKIKIELLARLATVNGSTELPRLLKFADSRDLAIRSAAIRLMGKIGNKGADAFLRKSLYESSERPRVEGAIALLNLHSRKRRR